MECFWRVREEWFLHEGSGVGFLQELSWHNIAGFCCCMECYLVCEGECFLHEESDLFCRVAILAIDTQVVFPRSAFDL